MITKVFSVYDSKAQLYNVPFFSPTTPAGVRSFVELVNDPRSMVNRHPDDFILYEIGVFDDSSGRLESLKEAKHLGIASQYKENVSPNKPLEVN